MFLDMQQQHGGHPAMIDLSIDKTFRHLCDPEGQYLWLDHRIGELFRLDLFSVDAASSTSPS